MFPITAILLVALVIPLGSLTGLFSLGLASWGELAGVLFGLLSLFISFAAPGVAVDKRSGAVGAAIAAVVFLPNAVTFFFSGVIAPYITIPIILLSGVASGIVLAMVNTAGDQ